MHGQETAQALSLASGIYPGGAGGQVERCPAVLPDRAALPVRGVATPDPGGQRQDAFVPPAKPGRAAPCCSSALERSPFSPELRPLDPRIHDERGSEGPLFVGDRTCTGVWCAARYLPSTLGGSGGCQPAGGSRAPAVLPRAPHCRTPTAQLTHWCVDGRLKWSSHWHSSVSEALAAAESPRALSVDSAGASMSV